MTYHPDRNNGSKEAEERFKEITEAYDVLRDPQKRAAYDRYGEAGLRGGGGGGFHHVDLSEALGIFMRDFGGFGGFEEMFGGGRRRAAGRAAGADVKITVPLTLAEVATGVEKKINLKVLDPCDRCDGSGAEPGSKSQRCPTCCGCGRGASRTAVVLRTVRDASRRVRPVTARDGSSQSPCKKCRGEGRIRGEQELAVQIPAGVATGQYMTLRARRKRRIARAAPRGDVHVLFEVADDPRFERDGEDLYTEVLVTYPQLVLGADLSVPAVSGHTALTCRRGRRAGTSSTCAAVGCRGSTRVAPATCTCACSSGRPSV